MANNFCRFLSNGYRFKTDGANLTYQPCCWFSKEISIVDNPNFDQQHKLISQIDRWTPACSSCKQIEDSGAYGDRSPRLRSFQEIPDDTIPDGAPGWLELSIDITCNAACIMCGPWHSTTWRKQELKFKVKTQNELPDIVDSLHWLDIIKSKFSFEHVKSVSFLGGEPFESPVPLAVLKLLKTTHGSLADVKIHFQTNASVRPSDELMQLASECKLVKFNLSIDGVGKRFEYLRYPIRWNKVERNIEYIKSLNLPNLKFVVLATVNALNSYYYHELESWVDQTFNEQELLSFKPNKSQGTVSLAQTPAPLRNLIKQQYGEEHSLTKLMSNLSYEDSNTCTEYLDWLDKKRNTSWRETFPDIVGFLDYYQTSNEHK